MKYFCLIAALLLAGCNPDDQKNIDFKTDTIKILKVPAPKTLPPEIIKD